MIKLASEKQGPLSKRLFESENTLKCKNLQYNSTETLRLLNNNCENYLEHFTIIE